MDFAKTPEQKQILRLVFARQVIGRPFVAPPGLPKERVAALRKAFMDTLKDEKFLAEAKKMNLEINAVSGEKVQSLIEETYKTPKPVADKVATMLGRKEG
jgi:tripartite-type tricarboxylate transporter receptor subunit TctC